jgi:hypothetical protein
VEAMGKANSFRRALHRVYEDGAELTRHPRSGRITSDSSVTTKGYRWECSWHLVAKPLALLTTPRESKFRLVSSEEPIEPTNT